MSQHRKLIERFLAKPADFTWLELTKLLGHWGYIAVTGGKTGGSRARFIHEKYPPIILHKPHSRPILKRYQIEAILQLLKQEGLV